MANKDEMVLLTGATGYIGGRLLKALETRRQRVRCLARRPEYLKEKVARGTEVVRGDVMKREELKAALQNVHTAYYLIHSMGSGSDFEDLDRVAAQNFAAAALESGVSRIVYLGGLGGQEEELSPHLRSRLEVGDTLRNSGVKQVIEFQASIVIGSGSLSFEMIRALVERLPIMITPRWVSVKAQPIAIKDLLRYLMAVLDFQEPGVHVFEIGGADQVSYKTLMREYGRQRGLSRIMIPVPVLTPRLSSLWLGLVTPLYARVGRKLIDSIRHPTVLQNDHAVRVFSFKPKGVREAIAEALRNEDRELAETRWSDARSAAGLERNWGGVRFGNRLVDTRSATIPASAEVAFKPIEQIGGTRGWYYGNWLWGIRGFLDLIFGGVGMRRGRRDPKKIRIGDVIDFWRVEAFEPGRHLLLLAEMKLPGRAWLEFDVEPRGAQSIIRQSAIFDPVGLSGLLYWYAIYPLHSLIFGGMLRGIVQECQKRNGGNKHA